MSISVYTVKSPLSQVSDASVGAYLKEIEKALGEEIVIVDAEALKRAPFSLVYVASGGSEGIFLSEYALLSDRPLYILTSGESNSLAASMEILSYLRQRGKHGEILHGGIASVASRIRALESAYRAKRSLSGMKLGLIGEPSDWLIASDADDSAYREKLNLSVVKIDMDELLNEIRVGGYTENEWTLALIAKGYDAGEMEKALNVYGAFSRIVQKYGLSGLSVRCFDLLNTVYTTGCLGLAILNACGIYGGCEGDVPSLISMAILGEISRKPVFLCNPSSINTETRDMVLAHCTLPINMPAEYSLTTHYESGIGVAVAGKIPEETCTVFKTSARLDRYFAKAARITQNLCESTLCRTQIKIQMDDFSYFLTNPINNHHLVALGDHTDAIRQFFAILDGE